MARRHKRLDPVDWEEFTAYLLLTDDWGRAERVVGTHHSPHMWKTTNRIGPASIYRVSAYALFYTRHWEWEFKMLSRTECARCEEILGKPTTQDGFVVGPNSYSRSNVVYKKQQPQIERFRKFVSLWMEMSAARREIHNILENSA